MIRPLLDWTLQSDVAVRVSFAEPWLAMVLIGLGCLVLAELFAEAVRLREFEESTI